MATPPKRVNAGEREVTQYAVPDANDRGVEREQQNRINKKFNERIEELDSAGGGGGPPGVTDHGALTGLNNDDHSQYHTDYRAFVWIEDTLVEQSGVDFVFDSAAGTIDLYILTTTGTATEALTAGRFVNLDASGEVQHADCSSTSKLAHGFVLSSYSDGATDVRVYYGAANNQLSGMTLGDTYYLSTAGQVTSSPPTTNSYVVQQLGTAKSATLLLVNIQQGIERPAS